MKKITHTLSFLMHTHELLNIKQRNVSNYYNIILFFIHIHLITKLQILKSKMCDKMKIFSKLTISIQ